MAFQPTRLKEAREALSEHGRRVSQERFAQMLGVSKRSPGRWENGEAEPRMAQLTKIAEITGRPIGWFFDGKPAPLPAEQRELFADLLAGVAAEILKAAENVRAGASDTDLDLVATP